MSGSGLTDWVNEPSKTEGVTKGQYFTAYMNDLASAMSAVSQGRPVGGNLSQTVGIMGERALNNKLRKSQIAASEAQAKHFKNMMDNLGGVTAPTGGTVKQYSGGGVGSPHKEAHNFSSDPVSGPMLNELQAKGYEGAAGNIEPGALPVTSKEIENPALPTGAREVKEAPKIIAADGKPITQAEANYIRQNAYDLPSFKSAMNQVNQQRMASIRSTPHEVRQAVSYLDRTFGPGQYSEPDVAKVAAYFEDPVKNRRLGTMYGLEDSAGITPNRQQASELGVPYQEPTRVAGPTPPRGGAGSSVDLSQGQQVQPPSSIAQPQQAPTVTIDRPTPPVQVTPNQPTPQAQVAPAPQQTAQLPAGVGGGPTPQAAQAAAQGNTGAPAPASTPPASDPIATRQERNGKAARGGQPYAETQEDAKRLGKPILKQEYVPRQERRSYSRGVYSQEYKKLTYAQVEDAIAQGLAKEPKAGDVLVAKYDPETGRFYDFQTRAGEGTPNHPDFKTNSANAADQAVRDAMNDMLIGLNELEERAVAMGGYKFMDDAEWAAFELQKQNLIVDFATRVYDFGVIQPSDIKNIDKLLPNASSGTVDPSSPEYQGMLRGIFGTTIKGYKNIFTDGSDFENDMRTRGALTQMILLRNFKAAGGDITTLNLDLIKEVNKQKMFEPLKNSNGQIIMNPKTGRPLYSISDLN